MARLKGGRKSYHNFRLLIRKNPKLLILLILTVVFTIILSLITIFEEELVNQPVYLIIVVIFYSVLNILATQSLENYRRGYRFINKIYHDPFDVVRYYRRKYNAAVHFLGDDNIVGEKDECSVSDVRASVGHHITSTAMLHENDVYIDIYSSMICYAGRKFPVIHEFGPLIDNKPMFDYEFDIQYIDGDEASQNIRDIIEPNYDDMIWGWQKFSNSWNQLRLRHLLLIRQGDRLVYYIGKTTYMDQALTGYSAEYKLSRKKTVRDLFSPYLGFYMAISRKIIAENKKHKYTSAEIEAKINDNLKWIPITNSIGMGTVIVTRDGYVLFPRRNVNQATEEEKLDIGISGSIPFYYLFSNKSGDLGLDHLIQSELFESGELNIPSGIAFRFIPITIMRNMVRLGSVVILGISVIDIEYSDILEFWERMRGIKHREFDNLYYKRIQYDSEIENLLDMSSTEISKILVEFFDHLIGLNPSVDHKFELLNAINNSSKKFRLSSLNMDTICLLHGFQQLKQYFNG